MPKTLLVNLHRILVFIRTDIKRDENREILEIMLQSLSDQNSINELASKFHIDFLLDDCYVDADIFVQEQLISVLKHTLEKLIFLLDKSEYEEAYDLTDAIHMLPEIVALQKIQYLHDYWNTHVEPLRLKWGIDYFQEYRAFFQRTAK